MAYDIHAWLDRDGCPHLELVDAESGRTRLDWTAQRSDSCALKSLFHKLLLVSLRERIESAAVNDPARRQGDIR